MELSELTMLGDEEKLKYLKEHNAELEEDSKLDIFKSIRSDDLKLEYLEAQIDEVPVLKLERMLTSLPDDSLKLRFLEKVENYISLYGIAIIVGTLTDDEVKLNFLKTDRIFRDKDSSSMEQAKVIKSLKSEKLKIDCLTSSDFKLNSFDKTKIIESLTDERLKIECLINSDIDLESFYNLKIIKSLREEQLKVECLTNSNIYLEPSDNIEIIESLEDEKLKVDCLSNPNIELELSDKVDLISTLTDDEVKLNFLKTDESFGDKDVSSKNKIIIIKSLKSDQLKIDCLTSSEFELNSNDKTGIIKSLSEDQLKIDCLSNSDINLESAYKEKIIRSLEDEQLKIDCLSNPNIKLEQSDKVWLISMLIDDEVKLNFLKTDESFRDKDALSRDKRVIIESFKSDQLKIDSLTSSEIELELYDKGEIIKSLKSRQLKIDCLSNSDINLESDYKVRVIVSLNDEQLTLDCLSNSSIGLNSYDKANLISTLTGDEVKLNFLKTSESFEDKDESSIFKTIIIKSFKNKQLKIDYLTSLETELNSHDKGEIIRSLEEEQLMVDCLFNPNINLESSDNEKIIKLLTEEQLKIDCLSNPNIELEPFEKAKVIISLQSDEVKLKYIEDSSIGFGELDKLIMILSLEDEKTVEKFGVLPDKSYKKALDLPSDMTIGVELEAEGASVGTFSFIGDILGGWKAKRDGSLDDGVEVVSPILHNTEEDMYSIAKVCDIMQRFGLTTSERCGGHIHFGADYFESNPKTWENFYTIYNECEEIFYKMSNEVGQVSRPGVLRYATTSNDVFAKMFETGEVSIKTQEEFNQVIKELKGSRYRGVNVTNLDNYSKNTIEFRMPNGTLNPKVIRENINLFGSLLQVSKQMTLEPENRREDFEAIKHKDLTEKEKTEVLLNILFDDEEEKNIYRERWDAVKDDKTFEQLKAKNPTFIRGDYSMKDQSEDFFEEVSPEDREEFLQDVRREIDNSRDRITEEQERS